MQKCEVGVDSTSEIGPPPVDQLLTVKQAGLVEMKPGDFVNIPAHKKHRVEWTTPDEPTIWLAMFYGGVA